MRIGIDIRKYSDFGIGTYISGLLGEFDRDVSHEWIYFASERLIHSIERRYHGRLIVNRSPRYSPGELFSISNLANRHMCDLLHSPHYTYPLNLKCKGVVTIHDLIHIRIPAALSFLKREYARVLMRHACRAADRIIVVSTFTKEDILREFDISPLKIHVVRHGVDRAFEPAPEGRSEAKQLQKFGIQRPYVLYSGALKAHKNIPCLLAAFEKVSRSHDLELVLCGGTLSEHPDLIEIIRHLGIGDRIVAVGRVPASAVVLLNQHAMLTVLPSLYEGFGLPIIEAMACGVPVIGSNATSVPELVGDAGLLFDPLNPDELAAAIDRVIGSEELRKEMRLKGLARAREFTWERCARETMEVYRAAAISS
jgi:glycosyltransferase involved in cell wall biosynthesis